MYRSISQHVFVVGVSKTLGFDTVGSYHRFKVIAWDNDRLAYEILYSNNETGFFRLYHQELFDSSPFFNVTEESFSHSDVTDFTSIALQHMIGCVENIKIIERLKEAAGIS